MRQLALVLGHELAHANLGHMDKKLTNQILGWAVELQSMPAW
jgi:Zn-dependent protease with chaperone function